MKRKLSIKFWLSFIAELILMATFWLFIFLLLLSVTGITDLPIKKENFLSLSAIIITAWLIFRVKAFKSDKFYINDL